MYKPKFISCQNSSENAFNTLKYVINKIKGRHRRIFFDFSINKTKNHP